MKNLEVKDWLLEPENPSVRYLTLKNLCDSSNEELALAKRQIMEEGLVPKILSKQNEDGSFYAPEKFYTNKYKGTVWTLLTLAELHADKDNLQIKKACEYILNYSQDKSSGGFSVHYSKQFDSGMPSMVIPCLTGNMVFALIRFGYFDDERVQNAIKWICKYQRTDDGVYKTEFNPKYKNLKSCFGKHSCHMGVAKSFKALAEIPKHLRTEEVNKLLKEMSEYFLIHHIYKKSSDLNTVAKKGWLSFGFPLMYQSDVLELLEIFAKLEIKDERLSDAISIVKYSQINGKWLLKNTYNGRTIVSIEKKGEPSKWITYKALEVLKYYL